MAELFPNRSGYTKCLRYEVGTAWVSEYLSVYRKQRRFVKRVEPYLRTQPSVLGSFETVLYTELTKTVTDDGSRKIVSSKEGAVSVDRCAEVRVVSSWWCNPIWQSEGSGRTRRLGEVAEDTSPSGFVLYLERPFDRLSPHTMAVPSFWTESGECVRRDLLLTLPWSCRRSTYFENWQERQSIAVGGSAVTLQTAKTQRNGTVNLFAVPNGSSHSLSSLYQLGR